MIYRLRGLNNRHALDELNTNHSFIVGRYIYYIRKLYLFLIEINIQLRNFDL